MIFPSVKTRYPEQDTFCKHMMEIVNTWRENKKVAGIVRIQTQYGECPLLQCKKCKVEILCTELWLGFISEEEQAEAAEWMKANHIGRFKRKKNDGR
jgi:hypothetical protein